MRCLIKKRCRNKISTSVQLCFKLTTVFPIQWFQYRVLRRILSDKNYLKKKLTYKDTFTFCGNDTETIEHIFATCTFTLSLCNQFSIHSHLKCYLRSIWINILILFLERVHFKKQTKW